MINFPIQQSPFSSNSHQLRFLVRSSPFYIFQSSIYPPANQLDQPLLLPAKIQSLPQTNPNIIWPYI